MNVPRKQSLNKSRIDMILLFSKGSRLFFLLAIVASVCNTVFNLFVPQVVKITVDSIVGDVPFNLPQSLANFALSLKQNGQVDKLLYMMAVLIVVLSLLAGVSNFVCRVSTSKGSESSIKRIRDRLFQHIQLLPFSWHVKNHTGDIIQRCTSDVDVVRNFMASQLLEVFRTAFLIVFTMSIMFSMNVKISFIVLGFIPILMGYSGVFFSIIAKKFKVADEAEGELSSTVQENLTGVRVVRAFGREKYEIDRFDDKNDKFSRRWINLGYILGSYWGIGDLFTGIQIMSVIVICTFEAVSGNISLGEFIAFVAYNSSLIWPIRGLGRILSEMSKASISIDRLNYILEAEEEQDKPTDTTPPMDGDICFKNINFNYEGLNPILKNIDFTIKSGSTFAILGGTGSGKSTLMHLLNRLYDIPEGGGEITIGGVNINNIKMDWLRSNIGMVLQEPFLFSRTIKENIAAFRPDAPLHEIHSASTIACVDQAIDSFTDGYETLVGERGVTLSGGQKQRVAIARMLMQNAPIMVFDDSLSAVDSETDLKIRNALHNKLDKATVILISHRITTLMQADMILVLEDGQIAEMGTHEMLIAKEGIYKDIYDIQMSNDDRILSAKEEK